MKQQRPETEPASELLRTALAHHGCGRLREAEAVCRRVLSVDPLNFDALHLLGVIANQSGNSVHAAELVSRALQQNPQHPFAHNSLGIAFEAQGRLDQAADSYRKALSLAPGFADAHFNLGNVLLAQGKLHEAVASFRNALAHQPDDAGAHNNLGSALRSQGKLDEAQASFRRALALKPDDAGALNNLGVVLREQGSLDEALACLHQALALQPDDAETLNNLGMAFHSLGRLDEAVACYKKSLALDPHHADACIALGNIYRETGRLDEAIARYREALALKPGYAEAYCNLGTTFNSMGRQGEAVASYRRAIQLKPGYAEAHNNLGGALRNQGRLDEAVASILAALSLKPDYAEAQSNLVYSLTYQPGCTPAEYLAAARRYGDMAAAQTRPYTRWLAAAAGHPGRPLRIGLVSGDFRAHPVGFFLENILARLDPERLQLVAYATSPREDSVTARIKPLFAAWNLISGLNDEVAARKIHADGIHVLIDLSGHTAHSRLPVFAWKPAPVQASWLGYWASTGVPGMDYLLADSVSVPESHQAHFTETICYLPDTRLCFTPPAQSASIPVSPLPMLRNGCITFGCFQSLSKINDRVLALWGRVLGQLPGARLRLQNIQMNCPESREQILDKLSGFGIAPERVAVCAYVPRESYLAAYAEVDIILDTFPFPGGTTTCEALWMGVPTLTLAGDTLLARQGASMLSCAGLEDWIAGSENDFITRAAFHAGDIERLARLRAGLRQQVLASPLFDGACFAGNLENALYDMWRSNNNPAVAAPVGQAAAGQS